jgi:hypothetical protein
MSRNKFSKFMFVLFCVGAAMSIYPNAALANQSGTYIASDPNDAFMARIIETSDNHIIGNLEITSENKGNLSVVNWPMTGEFHHNLIIIKINSGAFLAPVISASGKLTYQSLSIQGSRNGQPFDLEFTRGSQKQYNALVSAIQIKANTYKIQAQKAEIHKKLINDMLNQIARTKRAANRINDFNTNILKYELSIQNQINKNARYEQYYKKTTSKMRQKLVIYRDRNGDKSIYPGLADLLASLNDSNINARDAHIDIRDDEISAKNFDDQVSHTITRSTSVCAVALERSTAQTLQALMAKVADLRREANAPGQPPSRQKTLEQSAVMGSQYINAESALVSNCKIFASNRLPGFKQSLASYKSAFQEEEADWQTEDRKQRLIISAANGTGG